MPRVPDVLCAGPCGRLIWRGRGCLPPGKAMCRRCRASTPRSARMKRSVCSVCAADFSQTTRSKSRTCSAACAKALMLRSLGRLGACRDCGTGVVSHMPTPRCPPCDRERNRRKCQRRRDAGHGRVKHDGMTIFQLGDRDGWRCHLCRRRVDRALKSPDSGSATFDHLVPVSDGGDDSRANLRLAHLSCNCQRGDGGIVQLMLVG